MSPYVISGWVGLAELQEKGNAIRNDPNLQSF